MPPRILQVVRRDDSMRNGHGAEHIPLTDRLSGRVPLVAAQAAIATDLTTAHH
jgi:hypothetical protein